MHHQQQFLGFAEGEHRDQHEPLASKVSGSALPAVPFSALRE
jgi:hypothetical protein